MKLVSTAVAVLAVLTLAACGSGGASDAGSVTVLNTPTTKVTLTEAQAQAVIDARAATFEKKAKAFRKCDRASVSDSAGKSRCYDEAMAELAVVDDLLADLEAVELPASFAVTVADLRKMSAAGAAVSAKCAKANDQTCDQALARFRADEQSVLWDLDITL